MTPNAIMKKNKEQCAKEHAMLNAVLMSDGCGNMNYTIAPCQKTVSLDYFDYIEKPIAKINQEGLNPMCYAKAPANFNTVAAVQVAAPTVEMTQRDFLADRVKQIVRKLENETLRKQFNMDANDAPRTAKDLIKAIVDGDYTLDQKELDKYEGDLQYMHNTFGIRWGKATPDKDGYKAAKEALKAFAQETIDTVTLGTVEEGRQALKDLQAWTYKAAKK